MLPNRKIDPSLIVGIIRRNLLLVLVPPAVALFGALLYSSTVKNTYQSEMLIAIIPQRVPEAFVRSTVTLRIDERLDEIRVQVMSRTNLAQMITEMDLFPAERAKMPLEDVVEIMRKSLEVGLEPMRRGARGPEDPNAFHVRFTYTDPSTAAAVTQKIGARFVEQNSLGRGQLAKATNAFLETELQQARIRLEQQERKLEDFRQRYGKELPTQLQSNLEGSRSKQLQLQALVESIARDRDRKLMLERLYREAIADTAVVVSNNAPSSSNDPATVNTSVHRQLATAKANLAALEARYTADHPDVVRTRGQVRDLEQRATAEAASPSPGATTVEQLDPIEQSRRESRRQMFAEIESLDRQTTFKLGEEKRMRDEIAEYQRRVEAVPGIESEFVKLNRDYETNQTAYKELLTKVEAARVAVNLEEREIGEQFRIIDAAQVPVHPVTSIRGFINLGGLVGGLLVAVAITLFREIKDSSYRSEAEVLDVLALPVLALVPRIVDDNLRKRIRSQKLAVTAVAAIGVMSAGYLFWTLKLWHSVI